MKRTSVLCALALGIVCSTASAQKPLRKMPPYAKQQSLCEANDVPVMSCAFEGRAHKMASLCASSKFPKSVNNVGLYYVYGRPGKVELRYPARGSDINVFAAARQSFPGLIFEVKYSFKNAGVRYIMHKISEPNTFYVRAGLQVLREGQARPISDKLCLAPTLIEYDQDKVIDGVLDQALWTMHQDPALRALRTTREVPQLHPLGSTPKKLDAHTNFGS